MNINVFTKRTQSFAVKIENRVEALIRHGRDTELSFSNALLSLTAQETGW